MQDKLFRRGGSTPSPEPQQQQSDRAEPGLTINIPNKVPFPTTQAQPPPKLKPVDSAPKASAEDPQPKSYRQRLAEALGAAYKGAEKHRLQQDDAREKHWKRWGPYLSDRQWVRTPGRHTAELLSASLRAYQTFVTSQATVREDYSANGDAWSHFPHEHARSRAYRWGEDGLAGISDNHQRLCFGLSLWNDVDPILKERLFGVTGHQGNHGEDVKELYYYLDSTPTHSYMKFLYKYPQRRFPYEQLVAENQKRGRDVPEYEILDTGAFDEDRYWDVFVEVSKIRIGSEPLD